MPVLVPSDALFDAEELGAWLGQVVADDKAAMVEAVVWGWLKPVLGATTRPDPVTPEVFSWAIELAAIVHENPTGLSQRELGTAKQVFSSERRDEILRAAAAGSATSTLRPRGCFPAARPYPDPAC